MMYEMNNNQQWLTNSKSKGLGATRTMKCTECKQQIEVNSNYNIDSVVCYVCRAK